MSLTNVSLDTQCFLKHRRAAHALATDVANDVIFIAENNTKTISRVKLTNNEEAIVITGGTGSVEGECVPSRTRAMNAFLMNFERRCNKFEHILLSYLNDAEMF